MNPKDYVEQRLAGIKEVKVKPEGELAGFIFKTIMSKKFRKYSLSEEGQNKIRTAIEINLKQNEPIKFVNSYGGYKLWRFEESPEADWAELFAMIHYAYWLRPIADVYQPGVWLDFYAEDSILELLNNIPKADTEKYKQSFRELINFIIPYLPDNFRITFTPVSEQFSSYDEFLTELNQKMEELKQQGLDKTPLTDEQIEMIKLNVRPTPGQQLDLQKTRLTLEAGIALGKRRAYHKVADKIQIAAYRFKNYIAVGTTKTSIAKFQAGAGVLKKVGDSFAEYIFTPNQVKNNQFKWQNISFDGLSGKNFKRIRVVS